MIDCNNTEWRAEDLRGWCFATPLRSGSFCHHKFLLRYPDGTDKVVVICNKHCECAWRPSDDEFVAEIKASIGFQQRVARARDMAQAW